MHIGDDSRDMTQCIRCNDEVNVYIVHRIDEPHVFSKALPGLNDVCKGSTHEPNLTLPMTAYILKK